MKCPACDKELKPAPTRTALGAKKYCDVKCQKLYERTVNQTSLLNGEYVGKHLKFHTDGWIRNFLIEQFSYKCNCCGISEWSSLPIVLEVNHKDGTATNNVLSNLEFLCPNCHSQTDTFRNKNKGRSTRTYRKPL